MLNALEVFTIVVVGVMVGVEFSVAFVMINNRGKTWTPDDRPADWKQQLNRWDRLHYVRVAVIIAAFALLVAART
jgi:uncharacterized membrane protein